MSKYGLHVTFFPPPAGAPQYMAPILIDAADDAEAERQAEAVATFAVDARIALQIKITITTEPGSQVLNTIQRR
jgi:hypothetical protein